MAITHAVILGPTYDGATPANATVTPSFAPVAERLYTAIFLNRHGTSPNAVTLSTTTGLVFTRQADQLFNVSASRASVWTAIGRSGLASGTITFTIDGAQTPTAIHYALIESDGVMVTDDSRRLLRNVSVTTIALSSSVATPPVTNGYSGNGILAIALATGTGTVSGEAGYSALINDPHTSAPTSTMQVQSLATADAASAWTSSTAKNWALCALEIVPLPPAVIAASEIGVGALRTFFAEDGGFGDTTLQRTGSGNADDAAALFLAAVTSWGTEDFEGFADDLPAPLAIDFGGFTTATLDGAGFVNTILPPGTNAVGRYPLSGDNYYDSSSTFFITFSVAVRAFGFYGIDLGDFGGSVTLTLTHADSSTTVLTIPHTVSGLGGSMNFFGFVLTAGVPSVTRIDFGNTVPGFDVFGFDDMTVGVSTESGGGGHDIALIPEDCEPTAPAGAANLPLHFCPLCRTPYLKDARGRRFQHHRCGTLAGTKLRW